MFVSFFLSFILHLLLFLSQVVLSSNIVDSFYYCNLSTDGGPP